MRRLLFVILLTALTMSPSRAPFSTATVAAQDVKLPMKDGSVKFAVLGDTGTGGSDQVALGKVMKYELRAEGVTPATWDRESCPSIVVKK